jgi:hypothetical protein
VRRCHGKHPVGAALHCLRYVGEPLGRVPLQRHAVDCRTCEDRHRPWLLEQFTVV